MKLSQYQSEALHFAHPSREHVLRVAVAGMGLAGEAAEVLQVARTYKGDLEEMTLELGDVIWYGAELASVFGLSLEEVDVQDPGLDMRTLAEEVVILAGAATDYLKKVVGQGHPPDKERISAMLHAVFSCIARMALAAGTTLQRVCEANITKLTRRYPNGFTSERSIHRD